MSSHIILVCTNDCAFKFVTCSSADEVRNVAANSVGIRAARHGDEQMIGLDKLNFVDCEAVVNRNLYYCAEFTAVECFSENDVCNIHLR